MRTTLSYALAAALAAALSLVCAACGETTGSSGDSEETDIADSSGGETGGNDAGNDTGGGDISYDTTREDTSDRCEGWVLFVIEGDVNPELVTLTVSVAIAVDTGDPIYPSNQIIYQGPPGNEIALSCGRYVAELAADGYKTEWVEFEIERDGETVEEVVELEPEVDYSWLNREWWCGDRDSGRVPLRNNCEVFGNASLNCEYYLRFEPLDSDRLTLYPEYGFDYLLDAGHGVDNLIECEL